MTFQIAAVADSHFTGENAAYSRGFRACFRRTGEQSWKRLVGRLSESGPGRITIWFPTADEAKQAARAHLTGSKQWRAA